MRNQAVLGLLFLSLSTLPLIYNEPAATGGDSKIGNRSRDLPRQIRDPGQREVKQLAYSPKLKLIASVPGIYNFRPGQTPALPVYVWDMAGGKQTHVLIGHGQHVTYLEFTPDGEKLFSGASDGVVLWDPIKGSGDRVRYKSLTGWAALTPSGKELFQRDPEANVVIWDVQTAQKKRVLKAPQEAMEGIKYSDELSAAMSANERWLAVGAGMGNKRIIIWDYKTGKVKALLSHETRLRNISFLMSGRYLFAGGNEIRKEYLGRGVLAIWDTESWKLIHEIEVDEYIVQPILNLPTEGIVLSIDCLRTPEKDSNVLFKTLINGYSIKTGVRVLSYDTQLAKDGWCTAAIYMEDINAICIGGADGIISFFSVEEILKHKKQRQDP
jgi:WD40 repeat protein